MIIFITICEKLSEIQLIYNYIRNYIAMSYTVFRKYITNRKRLNFKE